MLLGTSILGVPYFANASDVRSTVNIAGQQGTLIVPLANQVKSGVTFGPDSNNATTGTYSGGGGGAVFPLGG